MYNILYIMMTASAAAYRATCAIIDSNHQATLLCLSVLI